jgi:spermidine synthase
VQLALIAGIGWAAWMIPESLPHWPINPAISLSPWYTFQLDLVRAAWVVLPAALCWGASLPIAMAACRDGTTSGTEDAARWVGRLYAANTLGSIVGALGFSLVVVPWLGSQGAERVLIALALIAALIANDGVRRRSRSPLWSPRTGTLALGTFAFGIAVL